MSSGTQRSLTVVILWGMMMGLLSCETPQERYRTLSIFFDGVPNPDDEIAVVPDPGVQELGAKDGGESCKPEGLRAGCAQQPDVKAEDTAVTATFVEGSRHEPYALRACNSCHDQSGSRNRLPKGTEPICFRCHEQQEVVPEHAHDPVGEFACMDCHVPHQSEVASLLKSAQGELCFECHDAGDSSYASRHNLLVEQDGCTRCHMAHGGDSKAFLKELTPERCGYCHVDQLDPKLLTHEAVLKGSCSDCHSTPHIGDAPYLEIAVPELCYQCHEEDVAATEVPHMPVALGECTSCHDPHGRGEPSLLAVPKEQLCWTCHRATERWTTQHMLVPEGMGCYECHDAHGGGQRFLLPKNVAPVCLKCHEPQLRLEGAVSVHPPVAEGDCGDCHVEHGSGKSKNLTVEGSELCVECHDVTELPAEHEDQSGEVYCLECHSPHASAYKSLLLSP